VRWLRVDPTRSCGERDGDPERDRPYRWSDDDVDTVGVPGQDLPGQRHGGHGVLQEPRLLHVEVGVAAGRQLEVAVEEGPRPPEQLGRLVRGHAERPTSRRMAAAAAAGLAAPVTGRPTTR